VCTVHKQRTDYTAWWVGHGSGSVVKKNSAKILATGLPQGVIVV